MLRLFFSFWLWFYGSTPISALPDQSEVSALLSFKQAITGGNLTVFSNWRQANSQNVCSDWQGVTCSGDNSHVVKLRCENMTLQGELSPQLGNLTGLQEFSVLQNALSGSIPLTLNQCKNLTILSLGHNKFGGPFPPLNLTKLQLIDLKSNMFTGQVPSPLGGGELRVLSLGINSFEGSIPSWIWSLSKLHILDIAKNRFQGHLPQSFNQLQGFSNRTASNISEFNQSIFLNVKGVLNQEYNVIIKTITVFDLSDNSLTGEIPVGLGDLIGLRYLDLSNNKLSGGIPSELGYLKLLEQLYISHNSLTGGIPKGLGGLQLLSSFNVSYNNLSGPVLTTGQFGTFDSSSYVGNPYLCGFISTSECDGHKAPSPGHKAPSPTPPYSKREKPSWWLVSYALGFVVGFSGVLWMVVLWETAWDFTFPMLL